MEDNAKVSLAVIVGAGVLILFTTLAFLIHRGLCACNGGADPGRGEQSNATLAGTLRQAREELQLLRQELKSSAADLERAHQELDASRNQTAIMRGNVTAQLQELFNLQQKVFNLSSDSQKLQDDLLTWKQKLSSTSEELAEAKSVQEQLSRQNKEYQVKVQQMEVLLHNGSGRLRSARLFGVETVTILLPLLLWVY